MMITEQRKLELDLLTKPIVPGVLRATPWDLCRALVGDDSASPGELYLAKQHADEFFAYINGKLKKFPKSRPGKVIPETGETRRAFYQRMAILPLRYVRDFEPRNPAESVYLGSMLEKSKGWQGIAKRTHGELEEFKSLVGGAMVSHMQKGVKPAEGLPDVPPVKRGRPQKRSLEWRKNLVARWNTAAAVGILKKDFCRDEGISLSELESSLRRVNEARRK